MLGAACSSVSVENGLLTCEFTNSVSDDYWGDADAQDAAVSYSFDEASVPHEDRIHFCKNFPWSPKQIGGQLSCGFDFICSECDKSFRVHTHHELEAEECLG